MLKEQKKNQQLLGNFDRQIFIAFVVLVLVAITLFSYKYFNYIDCESADFYIVAENSVVGETIEFYNETPNASRWVWDFGDSTKVETKKKVTHKYKKSGIFTIKLILNGVCEKEKQLEIKKIDDLIDFGALPTILAPKVVKVGDPIHFDYEYTKGEVFSYEWSFGETAKLDNTDSNPGYVYKTPGEKKITLILNGDIKNMASKTILVKPKIPVVASNNKKTISVDAFLKPGPPQRDPAKAVLDDLPVVPTPKEKEEKVVEIKKAPNISEEQFEILLIAVSKQSKTKEDFASYLCEDYDVPVLKNDKRIIPFGELCKRLKGKQIRIDYLVLKKNKQNCIVSISISYKIKKLLLWVNDSSQIL